MRINQELLRTFVACAGARTFGEAAAARRVTKSAVSQQMKTLEAQLGVPLFERVGRHARLTEPGHELAAVLKREFLAIDSALDQVVVSHREVRGVVTIGAPRPFARVWVRPRIAKVLRGHTDLRLSIVFGVPSDLEAKLASGELDLAVLARPPESALVASRPIFEETFVAYASPSYLAEHGTPRTRETFARHRFVVFDDDLPMHSAWWRAAFGAKAPLAGEIVCRVASLDEMLALAIDGIAIAALPDYFAREAVGAKKLRPLAIDSAGGRAPRPAKNAIHLAWRREAAESARLVAVREALSK